MIESDKIQWYRDEGMGVLCSGFIPLVYALLVGITSRIPVKEPSNRRLGILNQKANTLRVLPV